MAEESAHLAPHGVPGGAMPRGLSSAKLEEQDTSNAVPEQYGDNLNLPGGKKNFKKYLSILKLRMVLLDQFFVT